MESGALSVVVPTLNEAATLPRLAASLEGQGALELVVVDGGSVDATASVAARLGARVLEAPRGRGAQLALGAAAAGGDLLLFLHADARVEPGALDALRQAFQDHALCAAGMRQRIDHPRRIYRWIERAANARVQRGVVYGDSALCVRRSVYEAAGGFRAMPLFEDLDLGPRLARHGAVRLVEEAGVVVDPRRWEHEGPVRCTLRNWALRVAFRGGVAPGRLVRYYRPHGPATEPRP